MNPQTQTQQEAKAESEEGSDGQNLASTVSYMPYWLDSGYEPAPVLLDSTSHAAFSR